MTSKAICNVIRARVKAQLATYTIAYDNAAFTPPVTGAYLDVQVIFGEQIQVSLGSTGQKRFRQVGILNVGVNVPVNTGDADGLDIVDAITSAFRSITVSGVTFRTPSPLRIGQDGKYYRLAVQCPFYADHIG